MRSWIADGSLAKFLENRIFIVKLLTDPPEGERGGRWKIAEENRIFIWFYIAILAHSLFKFLDIFHFKILVFPLAPPSINTELINLQLWDSIITTVAIHGKNSAKQLYNMEIPEYETYVFGEKTFVMPVKHRSRREKIVSNNIETFQKYTYNYKVETEGEHTDHTCSSRGFTP